MLVILLFTSYNKQKIKIFEKSWTGKCLLLPLIFLHFQKFAWSEQIYDCRIKMWGSFRNSVLLSLPFFFSWEALEISRLLCALQRFEIPHARQSMATPKQNQAHSMFIVYIVFLILKADLFSAFIFNFSPKKHQFRLMNPKIFLLELLWHLHIYFLSGFLFFCQWRSPPWFSSLELIVVHNVIHDVIRKRHTPQNGWQGKSKL